MRIESSLVRDIESFILERISKYRIPSVTISITSGDEVIYCRGFGYRDVSKCIPAEPSTLYGIGSVTKSFTALGIMKLHEDGLLNLDDPVDKYVPLDIKPFNEDIRIHHLLTHSSGIPALAYAEAFIRGTLGLTTDWLPIINPNDIAIFMKDADKWVDAKPGEKFYYLNEGYVLLGCIISKLSGKKYEDYIVDHIFKPLNMVNSFFSKEDIEKTGKFATPYIYDKNGMLVESRFPFGITSDGGIVSNVLDLANYIRMYLNRGEFNDKRIIRRESIEAMEKPYIKVPFEYFGGEGYGYGWIITPNFFNRKLISHGGSVLVHTAWVGYIPKDDIGIALLSNSSGYPLSNIGLYVLTRMVNGDLDRLEFIRNEEVFNKLEGTYETYKGTMRVLIKRNGSFLNLMIKDRYTESILPLIPIELSSEKALFYTLINWRRYEVEFRIKPDKIELIHERYKMIKKSSYITS